MSAEQKPERLLWLDLETTGLDPHVCGIIEVGWAVTPLEVTPRLDVESAIVHPYRADGTVVWEPYAHEQHAMSGLLGASLHSTTTLGSVELRIQRALASGTDYYLAGSSIHFDRGFIRRHMPALNARLHHRMLDVSAVELARRMQGWTSPPSPDPKPHRVVEDLRNSHALLLAALAGAP